MINMHYNDPKGAIGATKTPLGLIPPHAMEQTAWVHKLGADKYGPWNWRETGVCASTYVNAILRHLNAWRDGEDLDPESGISHLAHVACSANILMDAGYCGKLQDDRNTTRQCNEVEESDGECRRWPIDEEMDDDWDWLFDEEEENPYAKRIKDFLHSLNGDEHRVLDKGEILQDGDEVYVGFGDWMTLYIPHWIQQTVNDGTYRRKVGAEPSPSLVGEGYRRLKAGEPLKKGDEFRDFDKWFQVRYNLAGTPACEKVVYRRKITDCDESCDSEKEPQVECDCGRRYVYHWLYGWICEDCDLKHQDPYNS